MCGCKIINNHNRPSPHDLICNEFKYLIRLGTSADIIDYLSIYLSSFPSIISTMPDNSQSEILPDYEGQIGFIRQGYHVREVSGQSFVMPDALQEEDLPLAMMHKPDFSKALTKAGGV